MYDIVNWRSLLVLDIVSCTSHNQIMEGKDKVQMHGNCQNSWINQTIHTKDNICKERGQDETKNA